MVDRPASSTIIEIIDREVRETYTSREQRAAYRAGMSSAAAICDSVASGTYSARDNAIAKHCGDKIWAARDRVHVTSPPQPIAEDQKSEGVIQED
jgi:hypothetical protein